MSPASCGRQFAAWSIRLIAVASAPLLASCGGGSAEQTAGIDGSGVRVVAEGPIEAFGSIVVGGQHYALSAAVVRVNGEIAVESDLALGQIVVVTAARGAQGDLHADTVDVEAVLRGPVQSVDAVNARIIVLEQEVLTSDATVLELGAGAALGDLSPGDYVEVSGFAGGEDRIVATRIESVDPAGGLRIVGEVEHPDTGALTFAINGLTVDYGSAGLIENFPGGGPADDDEVLVIGDVRDSTGALIATRLTRLISDYAAYEGSEAEVEGLITRFVSATDFDVAGIPATTTAQTAYEGGDAGDLLPNVKVQVEGRVTADGMIVASKIEIKDGGRVY